MSTVCLLQSLSEPVYSGLRLETDSPPVQQVVSIHLSYISSEHTSLTPVLI